MLRDHVRRLKHAAGKHQLPVQGDALLFQQFHIDRGRIVDQAQVALRLQALHDLLPVLVRLREGGHMRHARQADALQLLRKRLGMVDDMMSAILQHPLAGFGPRSRADHRQRGQAGGQLGQNRAHTARGADDEQALTTRLFAGGDAETLKQHLPGRDARQRQRRRLGKIERARLPAHDPLVHQMKLRIATRARHIARIPNFVAGLEKRAFRVRRLHHARRVPAKDCRLAGGRLRTQAHLSIDRVYGDGTHLHQQVTRPRHRLGRDEIKQRLRLGDRQRLAVTDGFHGRAICTPSRDHAMALR